MERSDNGWKCWVVVACAAVALGCGGVDTEGQGGTGEGVESQSPGTDTGSSPVDPGSSTVDAGSSTVDAGGSTVDAGGSTVDAGNSAVDAGSGAADAGSGAADAGHVTADAGSVGGIAPATGSEGCSAAPVLGPGSWQVDTTGAQGDVSQWEGTCGVASTALGPDRFFTVEVPAASSLRASLLPGAFSGARLALFRDCAAPTTSCERLGSQAVAWANTGSAPQQLLLAVDGFLGTQQGVAGVQVEVEPLAQQPVGATCAAAIPLSAPGSVSGTNSGRDNLVDGYVGPAGACLRYGNLPGMGAGGDVTYAVNVPPGKTLSVTATATGGWDVVVAILGECGAASTACAAWSDPGTAQATNTTGTTRTWYVVVDGFHPYSHGDFTLAASLN